MHLFLSVSVLNWCLCLFILFCVFLRLHLLFHVFNKFFYFICRYVHSLSFDYLYYLILIWLDFLTSFSLIFPVLMLYIDVYLSHIKLTYIRQLFPFWKQGSFEGFIKQVDFLNFYLAGNPYEL